jgi:hypothetical protein
MTDHTRDVDAFWPTAADWCARSTLATGGRSFGYATIESVVHYAYIIQCLRPAADELAAIWSTFAETNVSAHTLRALADGLARPVSSALMAASTFCPFLAGVLLERGATWSIAAAAQTSDLFGQCSDRDEKRALSVSAVAGWWLFASQASDLTRRFPDVERYVRIPRCIITPITPITIHS